jgi:5'-3' exonuclease
MGVPKFARWLLYNAKNAVVKHGTIQYIDSVSLDLNGILHKSFQQVYTENILDKANNLIKEGHKLIDEGQLLKKKGLSKITEGNDLINEGEALKLKYEEGKKLINYGNKLINQGNTKTGEYKVREGTSIINERIIMRRVGKSQDLIDKLEKDYQENVWQEIKNVIKEFGHIQTLLLCIDGISVQSKQFQQRQRRFKAANLNNALINFDSNVITPGTEFMLRLDNFLENKILTDRQSLPEKVIYSGCLTPGEGEGKIYDYFRKGEVTGYGHHVVYGLDADLIMLSLLSPLNNIILSRESQENMININEFKKYLINVMGSKTAVQDFVVMMFLIGNDFLPHSLTLENMDETINLMINIYQKGTGKYSFANGNHLNIQNLSLFINELAKEEPKLLSNLAFNDDYHSDALKADKGSDGFDLNVYRETYYISEFGGRKSLFPESLYDMNDTDIQKMVHSYMKTMSWNYLYYQEGSKGVNEEWLYSYYHSPMLVDLALHGDVKVHGYDAYQGMTVFTPLHQLICVLPRKSINIVPEELKWVFDPLSPLSDLFPYQFINEHQGKIMKKMPGRPMIDFGIAIIPIVDRRRIIDFLPLVEMSEERIKLWDEKEPIISIIKKDVSKNQYKMPGSKQQYQQQKQYQKPQYQKPQYQKTQYQPEQQKQHQQQYQQSQQQYQPRQQKQYQQSQQQYQQPYQSQYQPGQKQYQPVQKQPQKEKYQPVHRQPYKVRDELPQPDQPKKLDQYQQVHPVTKNQYENLPKMINLDLIKNYMMTGNINKNKNAREILFEENWAS